MKRIFSAALACVMALTLLTSCGGGDKSTGSASSSAQDPAFGADLTAFYTELMNAAEEGPMMMDLAADPDMLEVMYPGLAAVETKQLVVASPAMSAVAVEFAFAEVANAADVETVKGIFQARIDAQVNGGAWYPETVDGWQNHSEIVVIDNYVCLFVSTEKDGMVEAFRTGSDVPVWAKAQAPVDDDVMVEDLPLEDDSQPSFTLNKSDFTLKSAGSSYKLKAQISSGEEITMLFASSDESVATVAEDGTVTAVAPGTAVITVTLPVTGQAEECVVRCNWEDQSEAPAVEDAPAAVSVDLNAFVGELAAKHGENFAANANVVEFGMHNDLYPGISDINTKQLVIYQPMMGAVVCEIALAEVADAADVETVKAIFQARIDAQVDGGAWYPESIEGWKNNSRIVTNGNYVMMIAWQFCEEAVADFNALF